MKLRLILFALILHLSLPHCSKCGQFLSQTVRPPPSSPPQAKGLGKPTTPPQQDWLNSTNQLNSVLKSVLSAKTGIDTLTLVQEILFNSAQSLEMEETLKAQLQIANELDQYYGIKLKIPNWHKCSSNYVRRREILVMEVGYALAICVHSLEAIQEIKMFEDEGLLLPSALLKVCGEEARHLYENAEDLQTELYYESFGCSLEISTRTLEELVKTSYFEQVARKNQLLANELQYLLEEYELYLKTFKNATKISKKKEQFMKDGRFQRFADQVNLTKSKEDGAQLKEEVQLLKESVSKIPAAKPESFAEDLVNVADYVNHAIFERFLKIQKAKEVIEPDALREIRGMVEAQWKLISMVNETAAQFPQQYLDTKGSHLATIFTGRSDTFGKPCENSPFHLTGTCTPDNNEICATLPEWAELDPSIQNQHLIISDSMLVTKYCTCGFHKDCVPTAVTYQITREYYTCFLQPNANGQCRGGVGYPCRSLPLAEEKFDKSCLSERCDGTKDECFE